jgi:anaphase-promoting complex subunit 8
VQDHAKSSLYVARYNIKTPGGDLRLAKEYLERVAASNSEEVPMAAEMLTELQTGVGIAEAKVQVDSQSQSTDASQVSTAIV